MGSCLQLFLSHGPTLQTQCLTQSSLALSAAVAGAVAVPAAPRPHVPAMAKTAMGKAAPRPPAASRGARPRLRASSWEGARRRELDAPANPGTAKDGPAGGWGGGGEGRGP